MRTKEEYYDLVLENRRLVQDPEIFVVFALILCAIGMVNAKNALLFIVIMVIMCLSVCSLLFARRLKLLLLRLKWMWLIKNLLL